ncbi:MAG: hypothetical protein BA867_10420 [Desulfobacterales bacterium S5133MH16]|nr:MAG: hypothetical protein BA867_10420 [Desulfobacterales bacterium S5133MH16]
MSSIFSFLLGFIENFPFVKWFRLKCVTVKFYLKFEQRIGTKSATTGYGKPKERIRTSEEIGSKISIAIR